MKTKKTFFISGHRQITEEEFENNYKTPILLSISKYDAYFIIGDYWGVDVMAQDYLINILNYNPQKITVYHMFDKPRYFNKKIQNFSGGYTSDDERDNAMTVNSDEDIAFVRNPYFLSGTAQNILRRKKFKK